MHMKFLASAMGAVMLAAMGAGLAVAQTGGSDSAIRDAYRRGYEDAKSGRPFNDGYEVPAAQAARPGPVSGNDAGPVNAPSPIAAPRPSVPADTSLGRRADRGSPEARWQDRYTRPYSYQDDIFYRDCRGQPDPAGVIAGAMIAGMPGHTAGKPGILIAGEAGAALVARFGCADRSNAYKAYFAAFTRGRPHSNYDWNDPDTGIRGSFRIASFYDDDDGFHCATYSQLIFVKTRSEEIKGRACQQPDGNWVIIV